MDGFHQLLLSNSSWLLVCMGVTATIGLLHLWMARRPGDPNLWVAAWSLLACAFLGVRALQLTTQDTAAALLAGKASFALAPFLVWAIVCFGRSINGTPVRPANRALGAIAGVWALLIFATPWFVYPETTVREDLFGHSHVSVEARWPTVLLGIYIGVVLVHGVRRLSRSQHLERGERVVLITGFGIYAALGVAAILTGVRVLKIPALAEFGPFAVSVSLSYLMVHRSHRLEGRLADLLAERNVESQLRRAQRMESVGQLAAGIAHEINNPMAYVRANLGVLEDSASTLRKGLWERASEEERKHLEELQALVEDSRDGVERTISIARDMREFAHSGDEQRRRVDLAEVLESCVRMASIAPSEGRRVEADIEADLWLEGAPQSLRQAFLNLVINGLEAGSEEGRVVVEARRAEDGIRVRVHDDGPGIPEALHERLFDPFYSTRPPGEGTGLGLYMVHQILRSHGGEIEVGAGPLGGALFEVRLPVLTQSVSKS
ncbi:MAG: ATP-binding protein [Myxococcota bacterium]|nr:ATP-binding protein [Myxococcota bacterium]